MAWKHPNVYIDTSAWSPKYYANEFLQFANKTGRQKCMFGTNFPQLGWTACVNNVQALVNKGTLRQTVLEDFIGANAIRILKLPQHDRLVIRLVL